MSNAFNPSSLFASIVSKSTFNGRPLALAVNLASPGGQLIVAPLDPTQPSQQWMPAVFTQSPGQVLGTAFINMLSGLAAYVPNGNGNPVTQVPVSQLDEYSTWTFGSDEGGGYQAIRPVHDSGQNLNIPGNGPYTPGQGVVTWGWGGGGSNEIWTCIRAGVPYLAPFDAVPYMSLMRSIVARAGVAASNDPNNSGGQLITAVPDSSQPGQLFFPVMVFEYHGLPLATALVNYQSGLCAYVPNGNGNPVTQVPISSLTEYSTWTFGGNEGGGYQAIRPLHDAGQNLNVPGDGPYTPPQGLITWGWGGGDVNEVWLMPAAGSVSLPRVSRSRTTPQQKANSQKAKEKAV